MRDRRVFIKTLEGLQPVDVILRRLDDSFCDPLELRSDSSLGVAGLVEAARAGNVTIANALGSGVIETPAIMPFLPELVPAPARRRAAALAGATWWCGQPDDLQYVLEHLDELVVKRAFPPAARQPVFGRTLNAEQKSLLRSSLRARPEEFVAQEEVALSTAPVWNGTGSEPRPLVLRVYVAAAGDSMRRDARRTDARRRGQQHADRVDAARRRQQGHLGRCRTGRSAPSRCSRRCASACGASAVEPICRAASPTICSGWAATSSGRSRSSGCCAASCTLVTREDMSEGVPELAALLHVLVDLELLPAQLEEPMPLRAARAGGVAAVPVRCAARPCLRETLNELRRIAAAVRDRLSIDTWRILNQLQQDFRLRQGRVQFDDVLVHLNRMITDLAAFSGMEMENMTRGHGWRFLDIGRRLERSIGIDAAGAQRARGQPVACRHARAAARNRRQLDDLSPPLLRRGRSCRRSWICCWPTGRTHAPCAFQLDTMAVLLSQLPRDPRAPSPTHEERTVAHAIASLRVADFDALSQPGADVAFDRLTAVLDVLDADLRAVSDAITFHYFSHAELRVN